MLIKSSRIGRQCHRPHTPHSPRSGREIPSRASYVIPIHAAASKKKSLAVCNDGGTRALGRRARAGVDRYARRIAVQVDQRTPVVTRSVRRSQSEHSGARDQPTANVERCVFGAFVRHALHAAKERGPLLPDIHGARSRRLSRPRLADNTLRHLMLGQLAILRCACELLDTSLSGTCGRWPS